ncbi:hypothetical protein Tco_0308611, partial [Tanacetum coccineum]
MLYSVTYHILGLLQSGYAGNPNNNNGWIEADVPLLGELGAEADEPMVGPLVGEIVEPMVEMGEQVIGPVIDMKEDIAMLFCDGDFSDDDSEGFEDEEERLVKKVIQVSDVEVADGITIREIGPRVFAIEGKVQVMTSQMVQARGWIVAVEALCEQLHTMVSDEHRERKLNVKCIQGDDRRLVDHKETTGTIRKMELEKSQNNALAKLPMLKLGTLESGPSTALKMIVPSTAEEKICKKNDVKARSLLLMAL